MGYDAIFSWTQAGIPTRLNQWWSSIPFVTSGVILICGVIYLLCLLIGYDSYVEICFLPSAVASHFQVYRFYTSVLFHGSLLHVLFNMLALVPLGTELERIMGSVRLLFLMLLLATTNAILHLTIAFLVAYNPLYHVPNLVNECSIGFSGVIFSMIVIETSLSGVQSRSVFGLFNVPAKWYAWILLVLFQFLASNVSLLGHLCGILSGFACLSFISFLFVNSSRAIFYFLIIFLAKPIYLAPDTYGLFNYLLPGPSFYSKIEGLSALSVCVRRPGFIMCTGGTTYGQLPTYSNTSAAPSALINGNFLRNISSWMPSRHISTAQVLKNRQCHILKYAHTCNGFLLEGEDPRFPGRARTLGSVGTEPTAREASAHLHARLLDNTTPSDPLTNTQHTAVNTVRADATVTAEQVDTFDEELKKLVGMGFEKTQAEVALAAADGDPNVAIEILMSQQVCIVKFELINCWVEV
ncbi:Rhomboid-like protein 15 [Zea mays]|uniref:Rhomboid-like protein 15 n=1 Tax=Zea mays TaxID=4577 RepID=A0A317Y668_MAIZE|nr:Rhomboid-like protein 15 [Zea mays]